jgi:site-specific recombinase XerD
MGQSLVKISKNQEITQFEFSDQARAFVLKSNSPETRRTYETHIREFFRFHNLKHPVSITAIYVIRWRDYLIRGGSRPATVATKLSVVRSFFDYLREDGIVEKIRHRQNSFPRLNYLKGFQDAP